MKKTPKSIIAIVLAAACLLSLASCAKPKLNLEKAEVNLKDNGYTVTVQHSDDAGVEAVLIAMKNLVSDEETKTLTIIQFGSVKLAKLYYQSKVLEIEREIESLELEIKAKKHMINKFKSELDDKDIAEYNEDIIEIKQEITELKDDLKTLGRQGTYVWEGDREAIQATK